MSPGAAWLPGLLVAYLLVLLVAALGASRWPNPPHLVALLNELALLLFAPAPALLLLALALRRPGAIALAVAPVALFLGIYGARFIPTPSASAGPHGREIVVYTANIAERTTGFGALLDQIAQEQPDIVQVQELAIGADEFDAALRAMGFQHALAPARGFTGVGLWSRFPIQTAEVMHPAGVRGNMSQRVTLDVDGTPLTVFNVHVNAPINLQWEPTGNPLDILQIYQRRRRLDQVEELLADARAQQGPVILAGDFNLTDRTYEYHRLSEELTDSFAATGQGLGSTFPAPSSHWSFARLGLPLIRIDYVWAGRDVSPRSTRVVDAAGSDHLALVARLAVRDAR